MLLKVGYLARFKKQWQTPQVASGPVTPVSERGWQAVPLALVFLKFSVGSVLWLNARKEAWLDPLPSGLPQQQPGGSYFLGAEQACGNLLLPLCLGRGGPERSPPLGEMPAVDVI